MIEYEYLPTDAHLIKRVTASKYTEFSCERVDSVPIDTPVIVAFGGELTNSDKSANSYAKMLDRLFKENGVSGIGIYSVIYDFGTSDSKLERINLFKKAGRKINYFDNAYVKVQKECMLKLMKEKEPVPNYIKKLFDILLLPRISDSNGKKLSLKEAKFRISKIKFYAHSHGATTVWQLGHFMHETLLRLGYDIKDVKEIEKNLLVIQHGPVAPLIKNNFNTISFSSAEDSLMNQYDKFSKYLYENSADIVPSFFNKPYRNIFVAGRLKIKSLQEHDHKGLLKEDSTDEFLTEDGKIIFSAERNALINGAKHSLQGGKMPSISELTSGNGVNFEELKANGSAIYKFMLKDFHQQNLIPEHQK